MADHPSSRSAEAPASQSTRQLLDELDDLMQKMLALPVQDSDDADDGEDASESLAPPTVSTPTPPPRSVNLASMQQPAVVTIQGPAKTAPAKHVAPAPLLRPPPVNHEPPPRPRETRERNPIPPVKLDTKPAVPRKEATEPLAAPTYVPAGAEPLLPMMLQPPGPALEKTNEPRRPFVPLDTRPKPAPSAAPIRPSWMKSQPTAQPEPDGTLTLVVAVNRAYDYFTMLFGGLGRWLRGTQGRLLLGWSGIAMLVTALIWAAMRFLS